LFTDPEDLSQTAKNSINLNRGHPETIFRVRVGGLQPRTTYYYRVTSTESDGVRAVSNSSLRAFACTTILGVVVHATFAQTEAHRREWIIKERSGGNG
jgi:hypothetical protein